MRKGTPNAATIQVDNAILLAAGEDHAAAESIGALGIKFLDDSQLNVAAAKRVGMTAFQVQGPVDAEHALRQAEVLRV